MKIVEPTQSMGVSHYQDPNYDGETNTESLCGLGKEDIAFNGVVRVMSNKRDRDIDCTECKQLAD